MLINWAKKRGYTCLIVAKAVPLYKFDTKLRQSGEPGFNSVSYTHLTLPTNREV